MDTKTNPRKVARTRQYLAAKARQGERWRKMERAAQLEADRLLGVTEASRRWDDSDSPIAGACDQSG